MIIVGLRIFARLNFPPHQQDRVGLALFIKRVAFVNAKAMVVIEGLRGWILFVGHDLVDPKVGSPAESCQSPGPVGRR